MIEENVRAHISAASLGAPVFCGPVRPADPPALPYKAVFVMESGGPPPSPFMDLSTGAWRTMRVQIRVRGEPNAYQVTRDLAQSVWSAMQEGSVTGSYVRVTCEQSAPLYLGRDATGAYEYSVNALLEKRG